MRCIQDTYLHALILAVALISCTLLFSSSNTVWLQISLVKYFRDFREFRYDYENFCYEIFLTAASSTALDTS